MLSLTLRGLERDGLVTRKVTASIPPRVDYALTPMGLTLIEPLKAIGIWAMANRDYVEISRAQFDARPENATTTDVELRKRKPALMVREGESAQKPSHSEL
jgi:DNA-binding PadR family transcriptional regulator